MLNTYIYHLLPHIFWCLLHHLQGDHYVICSGTVRFVQCCYIGCAIKYKVNPFLFAMLVTLFKTICFDFQYIENLKC
jgi:hypothetical protein